MNISLNDVLARDLATLTSDIIVRIIIHTDSRNDQPDGNQMVKPLSGGLKFPQKWLLLR